MCDEIWGAVAHAVSFGKFMAAEIADPCRCVTPNRGRRRTERVYLTKETPRNSPEDVAEPTAPHRARSRISEAHAVTAWLDVFGADRLGVHDTGLFQRRRQHTDRVLRPPSPAPSGSWWEPDRGGAADRRLAGRRDAGAGAPEERGGMEAGDRERGVLVRGCVAAPDPGALRSISNCGSISGRPG